MNELEKIKKRFCVKNAMIILNIKNKVIIEKIKKLINKMQKYEKPDIIIEYEDKIIGIEHFEFDSSINNKKGSEFRIEESRINKSIADKIDVFKNENHKNYNVISTNNSLNNYNNNFIKNYKIHYKKVKDYISRIEKKFNKSKDNIEIILFAEDVNIFGNIYRDEKNIINPLYPFYSSDVIELLKNSNDIKYLIIGMEFLDKKIIYILENEIEILKQLEKDADKIKEDEYVKMDLSVYDYIF